MKNLFVLGINHLRASIEIREKFAFDCDTQFQLLSKLSKFADEIVLLSTCNRTEIIYHNDDHEQNVSVLNSLCNFADFRHENGDQFFYKYQDKRALVHLLRVAAGVDSMVPGETQILGQMKSAFERSVKHGFSKKNLHQVYQRMLFTAKKVRTETSLGRGNVSVGSVSVKLANNIFDSLRDKKIALIGAGEMCELAGEYFLKSGVQSLMVVNRTLEKAQKLADRFSGSAHGLEDLQHIMKQSDIILSSITCKSFIIDSTLTHKALHDRRGRPLFMIDIAVPRNIDPAVNQISDVFLYNIDDLQRLVSENRESRKSQIDHAERIITSCAEEFSSFNRKVAGELIQSLQERVKSIKNEELERLFKKNNDLSEEDKQRVEKTVNLIVNKILHDPIISLRRGLKLEVKRQNNLIHRFKDFFNL